MKKWILFLLAVPTGWLALDAQSLKKIPISRSGCAFYTYCNTRIDASKSQDSSEVYTGECETDGFTYGTICVKLVNPPETLQMAEDLLIAYLDFLKGNFGIQKTAGYGKGHILNKDPNTRGVLDYWQDEEKNNWKVKGWTNGNFIGIMYVFGQKDIPEQKANVFLDGFRLPEKK